MPTQQGWVTIPVPNTGEYGPEFPRNMMFLIGDRVQVAHGVVNRDRIGTVAGWGRSQRADAHEQQFHSGEEDCPFGADCDNLVDEEGPLIRYDDQDPGDESLDWFCGQGAGALEAV